MTLDTTARALADRLTDQFGKTVTLRRVAQTVYDPIAGTGGSDAVDVDYAVKVTPPSNFMFQRIDGTLIEEGDQVTSLPALNSPVVPDEKTDLVVMDGEEWRIKQIGRLYSGELVAMYILHITK